MFMFYLCQTVRYVCDVQQCGKADSEGTLTLNEDISQQNYTLLDLNKNLKFKREV